VLGSHAAETAARFGLGEVTGFAGPVARGRVGEIWRLDTERGAYAVKTWRERPDVVEVDADTALQDHFLASGVPMPMPVRTHEGEVLAEVGGVPLRVHTWVDVLPEDRGLDPVAVGELLALLHRSAPAARGPVDMWFTDAVGAADWSAVVGALRACRAPFVDRLEALVPDLLAAEHLMEPPRDLVACHRDLWADNLRATPGGALVALDWENAGPAEPAQELAQLVLEFGRGEAARWRALHAAYAGAGGPGRLREPRDFTMLLALQDQIAREACRRWLCATSDEDRVDNEDWIEEVLVDPFTTTTFEEVLDEVRST
jgi:Ser/Thr protein kinase RdoA (MazF antagonist)